MRKKLVIVFLAFLHTSFKENRDAEYYKNVEDRSSTKLSEDSSNNSIEKATDETNINSNTWNFYKISESSISGTAKKSKAEVTNQFKDTKIEIDDKNLKVGNICKYEYYKSNKTPVKYYSSVKTAKLYESIFLKNGLKLGSEIIIYQSLYPEKSCEIPWDEFLIVDNTLVIIYDDYLVFFK